jgi:hypothetical protein
LPCGWICRPAGRRDGLLDPRPGDVPHPVPPGHHPGHRRRRHPGQGGHLLDRRGFAAVPPARVDRIRHSPRISRSARASRLAVQIEVGLCWINSWFLRDLRTAFGGSKHSGIGREGGVHSLEFYTELRNVMIKY